MKKLNLLLVFLIGFTIWSCSSDDDQPIQLFNNAYAEIYTGNGFDCFGTLLLTNSTVPLNSDNQYLPFGNIENTHLIIFRNIETDNCNDINSSTRVFNSQSDSDLNSMLVPRVYYNITYDNEGIVNSYDEYYSDDITLARLSVNSNNSLDFEIRFEDGTILAESQTGDIETVIVEL